MARFNSPRRRRRFSSALSLNSVERCSLVRSAFKKTLLRTSGEVDLRSRVAERIVARASVSEARVAISNLRRSG